MPTPAIAFITENMRCDAGIMISASHNPYYDNGIKFFDGQGNKLSRETEEAIEEIFSNLDRVLAESKTKEEIGASKRIDDVIGRYIVHIKNSFPTEFTLVGKRIVVDCANGAAYVVAPTILKELGAELIVIGDKPDGFNINKGCGALYPERLAQKVKEYRADIGLALDGDADRIVIVDENGEKVDGDKLIGALAVYLKEKEKLTSNSVVATVMSNQGLDEYLAQHQIKLKRSDVGDKHVLEEMQRLGSNFGGEQSGHIIFSDFAKTGDGLVSALQALSLMIEKSLPASEAFNPFELYPQRLVNVHITQKRPLEQIDGLVPFLKEVEEKGMRHLIRYSGTENLIRLLLEGKDKKILDVKMGELERLIRKELC
jgi:phosphoglucosamine mutase